MRWAFHTQQKRFAPLALGLVVLAHAAVLSALMAVKASVSADVSAIQVSLIESESTPRAEAIPKALPTQPQRKPAQKLFTQPKLQTKPAPRSVQKLLTTNQQAAAQSSKVIPAAQPQASTTKPEPQITPAVTAAESEALQSPRFKADYLDNPPPSYPPLSRKLHEEGRVLLRVRVSAQGHAEQVTLQQSSGFARLDERAVEAVRRWQFVPARRALQSVAAWVLVPIQFSLKG